MKLSVISFQYYLCFPETLLLASYVLCLMLVVVLALRLHLTIGRKVVFGRSRALLSSAASAICIAH